MSREEFVLVACGRASSNAREISSPCWWLVAWPAAMRGRSLPRVGGLWQGQQQCEGDLFPVLVACGMASSNAREISSPCWWLVAGPAAMRGRSLPRVGGLWHGQQQCVGDLFPFQVNELCLECISNAVMWIMDTTLFILSKAPATLKPSGCKPDSKHALNPLPR